MWKVCAGGRKKVSGIVLEDVDVRRHSSSWIRIERFIRKFGYEVVSLEFMQTTQVRDDEIDCPYGDRLSQQCICRESGDNKSDFELLCTQQTRMQTSAICKIYAYICMYVYGKKKTGYLL